MKIIKQEEINALLQTIYQTNISAQAFDAIKQLFDKLPNQDAKPEIPAK